MIVSNVMVAIFWGITALTDDRMSAKDRVSAASTGLDLFCNADVRGEVAGV